MKSEKTLKTKLIESEVISKRFFESLGFKIRDRDFDGRKKGADFFIEYDGCIQSVEAKKKMGSWIQMLKPQLDRIKNGGLLAIVNEGNVEVKTIEDIERIDEVTLYRATIKAEK
jgi:hypothetical protein